MSGLSEIAVWTCTDDPCPWGESTSNPALAWPVEMVPVDRRLGYTVSPAAYLPAASANGLTITITSGTATLFAGTQSEPSHTPLATVSAGTSHEVAGLDDDEVLSVQSDDDFGYRLTRSAPSEPSDAGTSDGGAPDAGAPDAGASDAGAPDAGVPDGGSPDAGVPDAGSPDGGSPDAGAPDAGAPDAGAPSDALASQVVTWTCTGSPCPWGESLSGQTLVWPTDAGAITTRLGYTVSAGIYLPAVRANGAVISIDSGTASAFAGAPDDDAHRWLGTIAAGETLHISGLASREVLSVQGDEAFTYRLTLPSEVPDPGPRDVIASKQAFWRCNIPECTGADWTGAVIDWPEWAAYQNNARSGDQSRSVFSADGTPLYPYMGGWAQGCEVTAESGVVLIIEWQRGTDVWRETWLDPGQSHVINLTPPEDGAMIETYDGSPGFSVSLRNCTPQPLDPSVRPSFRP